MSIDFNLRWIEWGYGDCMLVVYLVGICPSSEFYEPTLV